MQLPRDRAKPLPRAVKPFAYPLTINFRNLVFRGRVAEFDKSADQNPQRDRY